MEKTSLAKHAIKASVSAGMVIALPAIAPFALPVVIPLMAGVLAEETVKELGKKGVEIVVDIFKDLTSSSILEAPNPLTKNPENRDLMRLLATSYLEAIKELELDDDENLKQQADVILPLVEKRIKTALDTKKDADLLALFPLDKDSKSGDLKYSFANRMASGKAILEMADESFSETEIFADEIKISLRRWYNEAKTAANQSESGITTLGLSAAQIPDPARSFLREQLSKSVPKKLGDLLKTEEFGKAWISFQRSHLQAILNEIKHNKGLSDEDRQLLQPLAEKLDEISRLTDLPEQLADSTSKILSLLDKSKQEIKDCVQSEVAHIHEHLREIKEQIDEGFKNSTKSLSDKIETTYRQAQNADEQRHQEILKKLEETKRADAAKQSQTNQYNPIPNPIPGAHDVFDRDGERADLMEMLAAEDTRLIRIVAPSGYGKTKLVFKFLKSVEPRIGKRNDESPADGVLLVNCKDRGNADVWNEILDRAGLMMGRREEFNQEVRGIQSAEGQAAHLLNALETAGRFWIVLDNFEDLLDKENGTIGTDADDPIRHLFHLLCHNSVKQRLIITTQHIPAFVGRNAPLLSPKHLIEVGGTPEIDAVNYLRDKGKTYLLDQINEAALLDFVRRVERLPLALVSLLRDLERYFESKPKGRVTVADVEAIAASATHYVEADRENGLRLWLTEQIGELHPDERVVLSVLSVFTKPCPQIALEFILPNFTTERIERLLARLERDRLIYQEDGGFQLSAIIRDAAYSQIPDAFDGENNLSADGQSDFNKRALHAQAASFYATQRKPSTGWKSIADVQAQLDEIQHRISAGEFETAANVLSEIDFRYLQLWGSYRLIIELREQLEGNLPENSFAAMTQANNLGLGYLSTGLVRKSIEQFEKFLQIARRNDDRRSEGASLGNLGNAYYRLGEYRKAIEYHEQYLAISREIGDRSGEGISLGNLGNAYQSLGEYRKAIDYHEQSLVIKREIGNRLGEGNSLGNLGLAYYSLGEKDKACRLTKEALAIFEAIESPSANVSRKWIEKNCGE